MKDAKPARRGDQLNDREKQVLAGMARGLSNRHIGQELNLAASTIKSHSRRLFIKMGVHTRAGAVGAGFRCGLLQPGPADGAEHR